MATFFSADEVQRLFDNVRPRASSFSSYWGRDGRHGRISSSTTLGHDWVLAESQQIAVQATPVQVLQAYLSGALQTKWNADSLLHCQFTLVPDSYPPYYRQDLVLKSQRVIRRQTGIMRYSQRIVIDQIGGRGQGQQRKEEDNTIPPASFCAYVSKLPLNDESSQGLLSPFERLHVFVHLEAREDGNTHIYAAGLFRVNRRVIPHLFIFDAAGIAGTLACKGALWSAAHFDQLRKQKSV